jgi:hypothetical protein
MVHLRVAVIAAGVLAAAVTAWAAAPREAEVRTSDVDLFYRLYDAADGKPTAEALQHDYIDAGTDGVRQFVPKRIVSGEELAKYVAANPDVYANARRCLPALPAVRARLHTAFGKLARLYPEARFAPVTILIGRNNSGGTTGKSGVLIGLEASCRKTLNGDELVDYMTHLIMHEYGHVQQFPDGGEDAHPGDVLTQSLIEGEAELVAELTTGQISNAHLLAWTKGHERAIDEAFVADIDKTDATALKRWLYNGRGTAEKPGDLGYWVGWRIAKAYYLKARDKHAALKALFALKDPKAILAASGWKPGDPE